MKKEPITIELQPIEDFRLPRYSEIPNVGLYLKQVVRFINDTLVEPLGTGSSGSLWTSGG